MKRVKFFAVVLLALALAVSAQANIINISMNPITGLPSGDVDKGYFGNNNPSTNFNGLLGQISLYNSFFGTSLQTPTFANYFDGSNNTVNLTGFDYAVIHYGKGPGGIGQGGGIAFFYLNGMTGNFTFSANGHGPNGFGGFSSIRLFSIGGGTPVPEGSATAILLCVSVLALFGAPRLVRPWFWSGGAI
jgi:hypothetical protein